MNVRVRMVSAAEAFRSRRAASAGGRWIACADWHAAGLLRWQISGDAHLRPRTAAPGRYFCGPAIVSEYSSATVLPPGDVLRVDGLGNLVIEVH